MKLLAGLTSISVTVVITLLTQTQSVFALTDPQIGEIAEKTTVRIVSDSDSGSGVIIAKKDNTYYILTCKHVIPDGNAFTVITPDNRSYSVNASTVKRFPGVDLAVTSLSSNQSYQVVKVGDSNTVKRGMASYVSGWGMGNTDAIKNFTLMFRKGEVSAVPSVTQPDGYALIYSNNTLPGMSGGPVLNEEGELIGIHGRGEVDRVEKTENSNIAVKIGYNLAVPINTFLSLAPKLGLNLGLASLPAKPPTISGRRTADDFYAQAISRWQQADYKGVLAAADSALKIDPNYADALALRGKARSLIGDDKGALQDINGALKANSSSAEAYFNRGHIYFRKYLETMSNDFLLKALEDFNQAIKLKEDFAQAYYERYSVRSTLGDSEGGSRDMEIYTQLKASNLYYVRNDTPSETLYYCAQILAGLGLRSTPIEYLRKAQSLEKSSPDNQIVGFSDKIENLLRQLQRP
jgi:S1-C subfamily serine protease